MSGDFPQDYSDRFGGMGRLLGQSGLEKVRKSRVAVIGVGGVGSWTVEALVRSGVGAVTMVDLDDVCITNVNRQLPALDGGIGRPKVEVLAERMRLIHPGCRIEAVAEFLTPTNARRLLSGSSEGGDGDDGTGRFDFVIDAVDRISTKVLIITECRELGIPVLTVGGAGGRRDATAVRTADLGFSQGDSLLRGVRRELRRRHGFSSEDRQPFGIPCIYSAEPQVFPWADGTCRAQPEEGGAMKLDCASGFGAATFVTGVFGFAAAGEVIRQLSLR